MILIWLIKINPNQGRLELYPFHREAREARLDGSQGGQGWHHLPIQHTSLSRREQRGPSPSIRYERTVRPRPLLPLLSRAEPRLRTIRWLGGNRISRLASSSSRAGSRDKPRLDPS